MHYNHLCLSSKHIKIPDCIRINHLRCTWVICRPSPYWRALQEYRPCIDCRSSLFLNLYTIDSYGMTINKLDRKHSEILLRCAFSICAKLYHVVKRTICLPWVYSNCFIITFKINLNCNIVTWKICYVLRINKIKLRIW